MKVMVIGIGRVGLPLALVLNDIGHEVVACDMRAEALQPLIDCSVPFDEPGIDALLAKHTVKPTTSLEKCDVYVITVGTPVGQHFVPDTSTVKEVIEQLFVNNLMIRSTIILRSTIPVGFTDGIIDLIFRKYKMLVGVDYHIAYCPERIAEGAAIQETRSHPQIVGVESPDDDAFFIANRLFSHTNCILMGRKEAEFAKLATNTYRYMHFAIANYLEMAGASHGVDFIAMHEVMKLDYPRLSHLPIPGFVGGTCLRKDFAMLATPGDMAYSAYMLNEYYPRWIAQKYVTKDDKVAIIGAGFKDNSDDLRDSLVDNLYQEVMKITGVDPMICDLKLPSWEYYKFTSGHSFFNRKLEEVVFSRPTVVIFGNPQSDFNDELHDSGIFEECALLVDPFGTLDVSVIDFRV